jgi:plastocyanin
MTDDLVFDPDELTIAPGDTVVWETVGSVGHSVTAYADEIPADAAYFASGGFDGEEAARSGYPGRGDVAEGETFEHTFEVEGTYGYFCIPHEAVGMLGEVTVTTDAGGDGEGGGEVPVPGVPEAGQTLGVAATIAMVSVLAMTYVVMRFGGYE